MQVPTLVPEWIAIDVVYAVGSSRIGNLAGIPLWEKCGLKKGCNVPPAVFAIVGHACRPSDRPKRAGAEALRSGCEGQFHGAGPGLHSETKRGNARILIGRLGESNGLEEVVQK